MLFICFFYDKQFCTCVLASVAELLRYCHPEGRKAAKKTEPGSFQWCSVPKQEARKAQTGTQKMSDHQEALLCCADDGVPAQAADFVECPQRSSGTTSMWSWAPCSGCLCLSRGWSRCSHLNHPVIL